MTKIPDGFIQRLKQAIGAKYVYTDTEILEAYNFDGTEYRYLPDLVAEPETTGQISELMKLASAYRRRPGNSGRHRAVFVENG